MLLGGASGEAVADIKICIQSVIFLPEACRGFWERLPGKRLRLLKYVLKIFVRPDACRGLLERVFFEFYVFCF